MEIPAEVLKAAKALVAIYGPTISFLGERSGQQAYVFNLPDDEKVGFPSVFLYEKGKPVLELTGFEALDIIDSFAE